MGTEDVRVLCYSGGMDSYCLRALNDYDEFVYFDVGTVEASYEREIVREHEEYAHIIDMGDLSQFEMGNKTIPLRNVIFSFLAANYGNEIHLGGTYGDRFNVRDGDEIAADMASALLNHFNGFGYGVDTMPQDHSRYSVEFPLCGLTKAEIVQKTVEETDETPESIIRNSKSCHHGTGDEGCGQCEDCLRTATAIGYALSGPQELDNLLQSEFSSHPFEWFRVDDSCDIQRREGEYEQFAVVFDEWNQWRFE